MKDVGKMSEEELLRESSNWCDYPHLKGYFGFHVANALVRTGHWLEEQVTPWGYIMKRAS